MLGNAKLQCATGFSRWTVFTLAYPWSIQYVCQLINREIDKSYSLSLPPWKKICHSWSSDQPQPWSFFQRPREAAKREPWIEVGRAVDLRFCDTFHWLSNISHTARTSTAVAPDSYRRKLWFFKATRRGIEGNRRILGFSCNIFGFN